MAGLNPRLEQELREAVIALHIEQIQRAIDHIEGENAELASRLRELANEYDYDALLELVGERQISTD